ncbi:MULTISPECIES: hypothetical protein [unclassified Facklamia]|uniref:hypothetical protein n=1 Tax=Aerococcaceae TaxID=186827 RepID=UPI0013BCC109|nr:MULTISPECIES: hypothetical protein [unclassified Facklamia]NEW63708.1 hypothetical protein [Facklamia sp. 252]NEW67179.1 hypothetical protein [Facklamia sp. 253]QQD66281.1 hypothetical protein JDW14_04060 [Aerococcaceae bacterium zg-252]
MRRISVLLIVCSVCTGCQMMNHRSSLSNEISEHTTQTMAETTVMQELERYTALEIREWSTGLSEKQKMLKDILSKIKTIDSVEYIFEVETLSAERYQVIRVFENYRDGLVMMKQYRYDAATQKINEIEIEKEVK